MARSEKKKHIIGNISLVIMGIVPVIPKWLAGMGMYQLKTAIVATMFLAAVSLGIYGTVKEKSWTSHGTLILAVLYIGQFLASN